MTITALPTPPSRTDDPGTFAAKSDALLGALPAFVTETNATAADVVTKHGEVIAAKDLIVATNPETNAAAAAASASTATTQAGISTTQAGIAATKAAEAAASAAEAVAAAGSVDMPVITPSVDSRKPLMVNEESNALVIGTWLVPETFFYANL